MDFRMYLLDDNGQIQAAHSFSEATDGEAADFTALLYSLCDDVFTGYEVWRGTHIMCAGERSPAQPKETLASVNERRQRLVVEREESLMDSFACVRSSRKLIHELDALRERLRPPTVADEISRWRISIPAVAWAMPVPVHAINLLRDRVP